MNNDTPPLCAGPDRNPVKPRHAIPAGVIDCHCHVFEDQTKYPLNANRSYTPPLCTREDYLAMCATLGIARTVQINASVYGPDNPVTLDLIKALGQDKARGVGGLFFDDLNTPDFDTAFAVMRSVGDHFLPAYVPIVERRLHEPYGERERNFQEYRRGRYVEFNLVFDRGTLFGLQSGGRTESIFMSMPPRVQWKYDWKPEPGSPEAALYTDFLPARDWLGDERL